MSSRFARGLVHLHCSVSQRLAEGGYIEGQNVAIEYRWAAANTIDCRRLATDLVRAQVSVIAAPGGAPAPLAAKAAPRRSRSSSMRRRSGQHGLVASLNRPGGNVTGVTLLNNLMEPKRLGLLRELCPRSPPSPSSQPGLRAHSAPAAAARRGVACEQSAARHRQSQTDDDLDAASHRPRGCRSCRRSLFRVSRQRPDRRSRQWRKHHRPTGSSALHRSRAPSPCRSAWRPSLSGGHSAAEGAHH